MEEPKEDYSELQDLIIDGFVKSRTEVWGVPVIWKSMTAQEGGYIEDLSWNGLDSRNPEQVCWILALSVYMIDGVNMLSARPDVLNKLNRLFLSMPQSLVYALLPITTHLQKKSLSLMEKVEVFSDSVFSQVLWELYKTSGFPSFALGDCGVGISNARSIWVSMMAAKEKFNLYDHVHDLATFVGGFFNPKAAQQIFNQKRTYESLREQEKEDAKKSERLSKPLLTRADLDEALKNQIHGVKDEHDKIIEKHEMETWNKMVAQYEQRSQERLAHTGPLISSTEKVMDLETIKKEMQLRVRRPGQK